jgi:hypothetical protein
MPSLLFAQATTPRNTRHTAPRYMSAARLPAAGDGAGCGLCRTLTLDMFHPATPFKAFLRKMVCSVFAVGALVAYAFFVRRVIDFAAGTVAGSPALYLAAVRHLEPRLLRVRRPVLLRDEDQPLPRRRARRGAGHQLRRRAARRPVQPVLPHCGAVRVQRGVDRDRGRPAAQLHIRFHRLLLHGRRVQQRRDDGGHGAARWRGTSGRSLSAS